MEITISNLIAGYGAILSSVLAILAWRANRTRFESTYLFTSSSDEGSKIVIHNPTSRSITIKHWKLLWVKGFPACEELVDENEGYEINLITVLPHQQYEFHFGAFEWGISSKAKGTLTLWLYIFEKTNPIKVKVYNYKKAQKFHQRISMGA